MDQNESAGTSQKNNREIETLALMVAIYCRGKHKDRERLNAALEEAENASEIKIYKFCTECFELVRYATERVENCPVEDSEAFCSNCEVHCYRSEMREKIREVMRYSGPRMILYHPRMALRHMFAKKKPSKKS